MHPRPNVAVQPRFTIFGAEDNMNDDLTTRLRHCGIIAEKHAQENRAVSASEFFLQGPEALPQANMNIAPLALNTYSLRGRGNRFSPPFGRAEGEDEGLPIKSRRNFYVQLVKIVSRGKSFARFGPRPIVAFA